MLKWFTDKSNKVSGPLTVADWGLRLGSWVGGLGGTAALIAGLSSTWDWYWTTYGWAGMGVVFLISCLVLALCFFLTAAGIYLFRKSRLLAAAAVQNEKGETLRDPLSSWLPSIPDQLAETQSRVDNIAEKLEAAFKHIAENIHYQSERFDQVRSELADLSGRLRTLETTLQPRSEGLLDVWETPEGGFKTRLDAIEAKIRSARDYMSKALEGVTDRLDEQRRNHAQLHDRVHATFVAKEVEKQMDQLIIKIKRLDSQLRRPAWKPEDQTDWARWEHQFEQWQQMVRDLCEVVRPYIDVEVRVFSTPNERYKGHNWNLDHIPFPDDDHKHDFKTFYIVRSNLEEALKPIIVSVRDKSKVGRITFQ